MQDTSRTDRMACAILIGEQALNKAVDLLVEAGFATEHIRVLWQRGEDDNGRTAGAEHASDASSRDDDHTPRGATAGLARRDLVDSAPDPDDSDSPTDDDDDDLDDDLDEASVLLRTGIRRMLPVGALLGALGAALLVWFDGDPTRALLGQLIAAAITGAFLGGMAGLVMGLGHWEHFIDLPAHYTGNPPTLVAVDVVAQGREPQALSVFEVAGGRDITVCSSLEAEQLVRAQLRPRR